jgi:hypothetical protein
VRAFGLDVHRDFCEVAIAENDTVRSAGRIPTPRAPRSGCSPRALLRLRRRALEATSGADRIVAVLQGQGVRVIVANTPISGFPSTVAPNAIEPILRLTCLSGWERRASRTPRGSVNEPRGHSFFPQ